MAEHVEVWAHVWPGGRRDYGVRGPVRVVRFVAVADVGRVLGEIGEALQAAAHELGANTVVGASIDLDPWAVEDGCAGVRLVAVGVAKRMEAVL